jgi:hypothetical protein
MRANQKMRDTEKPTHPTFDHCNTCGLALPRKKGKKREYCLKHLPRGKIHE